MGWTVYVVISDLKCAFETNREVDKDSADMFDDSIKKLTNELVSINPEVFDTPVKDISITDMASIISLANKTLFLNPEMPIYIYFLTSFLKSRKIGFEIMHQDDFEKGKKDKYKDYAVIRL